MDTTELMGKVTAQIATAIADGIANPSDWSAPWHRMDLSPINAVTANAYSGGNRLILGFEGLLNGAEPHWATYRQWASIDAQVRKGEKASHVVRPAMKKYTTDDGTDKTAIIGWRLHPVFHSGQVDGYDLPVVERDPVDVDDVFAWAARTGADIVESATSGASYSPVHDRVTVPARDRWMTADGAWSTLAHELAHWSGHESRLDRSLSGKFGSESYAAEELIAELAAAFTMAKLGRASEPRPDHAHYLASWLKVLDSAPDALWSAASAAEKAAGFVLAAADRELVAA
jgi:antirestriction protein ArdC